MYLHDVTVHDLASARGCGPRSMSDFLPLIGRLFDKPHRHGCRARFQRPGPRPVRDLHGWLCSRRTKRAPPLQDLFPAGEHALARHPTPSPSIADGQNCGVLVYDHTRGSDQRRPDALRQRKYIDVGAFRLSHRL